MYTIIFKNKARKELLSLPEHAIVSIEEKIDALAYNPRPSGYKKLKGSTNEYRIRIGNYRVLYTIHDDIITVYI